MRLPLRGGSSPGVDEADPAATVPGSEPAVGPGRGRLDRDGVRRPARAAAGAPTAPRPPGRSVAMAGNYLAVLLPDEAGITLIDAMSGTPLRKLTSPGRTILGVIADPAGRRLLTIEQSQETPLPTDEETPPAGEEIPSPRVEYQVNLWDMDRPRPTARRRGAEAAPGAARPAIARGTSRGRRGCGSGRPWSPSAPMAGRSPPSRSTTSTTRS